MSIDKAMFVFAGVMIIISVLLTQYVHANFFWFTLFIGANLLQSAFTGFCPAAKIFSAMGLKTGCAFVGKDDSK